MVAWYGETRQPGRLLRCCDMVMVRDPGPLRTNAGLQCIPNKGRAHRKAVPAHVRQGGRHPMEIY